MLFTILKDKFNVLTPIPESVLDNGPKIKSFIVAKKDGQDYITIPVSTSKLQALFDAYEIQLPSVIQTLTSGSEYLLVDVSTITSTDIKIYIRKKELMPSVLASYPYQGDEDMVDLMGMSFLINSNSVKEYKYYFFNQNTAEYSIYRFDETFNLLNQEIESTNSTVTEEMLLSFDSRLTGINLADHKCAFAERVAGNQKYVIFQENFFQETSNFINSNSYSGYQTTVETEVVDKLE